MRISDWSSDVCSSDLWFLLHGQPWVWTLLALAAPAAYLFTDLVTGVARGRRRGVMQRVLRRQADQLGRWALAITFLVSDTFIALHAIFVTLWRLRSGRKRLEWTSAAHMASRIAARHPRLAAWRDMAARSEEHTSELQSLMRQS